MASSLARLVVVVAGVSLAGCGAKTVGGDDAGGSAAPSDGGLPAPAPVEVCPAPPVRSDFESGLDPSWRVTDESAFRLDADQPLGGATSLRIAFRQKASFITIPMPSVCAVRIAFTLRADAMLLAGGGVTIARVTVGAGTWFHLLLSGQGLSLAQETRGPVASGIGFPGPSGPLAPDTPTAVVVTVDLRSKSTSVVVAPVGEPLPDARATPMRLDESDPSILGPITAVDLGAAPGVVSEGVGILWMDDLSVD